MPDIDIKCIVFSAGRPAVLIGGNEIIHEGGTIAGATVTRIMVKKNTVEFEMNRRIWQHRVNK